jgi:Ca-activated chloride channel family protein
LPLRGITLTCDASAGIARTKLHQHFSNEYPDPLELTYLFPLPADGTVSGYTIRAGNRLIRGHVERRAEARAQYDAARVEGRTAALVEQERPNLFTQHLGNIPASTDVIVELTIDQPLRWVPGHGWEWRFPTVVAPRFLGAPGVVVDAERVTVDVVDGVTPPTASVALTIQDDLPIAPASPTHQIEAADHVIMLAADAALDRDIVIRWAVPGHTPGCSLRTMRPPVSGDKMADAAYGLLTIVPPTADRRNFARDLVLLLDTSGSMSGNPLEHLKAVVTALIETLRDEDRLEMVAFSSGQVRYRQEPVLGTATERRKAAAWIERLEAHGGTELISAINEALRPLRDDLPRQVVVVTDGQIGFEASAVHAIRDGLPRGSRLHTVGVGSASNRAFLRPAARAGRGVEVLIDLDEPATDGVERIVAATREPVISDVAIEGTALQGAAPRLPDLLAGSPVLAALRLRPEGGTLLVHGQTAQGSWQEHLDVQPIAPGNGSEAIPALWAREAIEDLELDLACGTGRKDIDRHIEEIALQHSVSSRLTSWVAIAEEPSVDPRAPVRIERIPQALPYGMTAEGLGLAAARSMPSGPLFAMARGALAQRETTVSADVSLAKQAIDQLRQAAVERRMASTAEKRRLRETIDQELFRLTAEREEMERSWAAQMEDITRSLRQEIYVRLDRLRWEIDERLSTFESAALQMRESWSFRSLERIKELRARIEAAIGHFETEQDGMASLSSVSQIEQLLARVAATQAVPVRGRLIHTPGRPTVTIEFVAASGLDWRPATTATVAGRSAAVVETGTTRPGPIAAASLVRVEIVAALDDVRRAGSLEIECGDTVLRIALATAE